MNAASRRTRRSVGAILGGVAALLVVVLLAVRWARSSTDTSTIARALVWARIGRRRSAPVRGAPHPDRSAGGAELDFTNVAARSGERSFDDLLRQRETLAFLVVHGDRVVYERYYDGATRSSRQTSFSVAKSFLSTLVGIAIDEKRIGSVDDPVTTYLPDLAERDRRFEKITLRDLLTMSSGIRSGTRTYRGRGPTTRTPTTASTCATPP